MKAGEPVPQRAQAGLRRIRALVALALTGAIVLGVVGAVLALRTYDNAKRDELARITQAAIASRSDIAAFIASRTEILRALGSSDSIVRDAPAAIDRRLARLRPATELTLDQGLVWFDRRGIARSVNGAAIGRGTPARGELARILATARRTGTPVLSGRIDGSAYGVPVVVLAVPTTAADGRVNGTLAGALSTDFLNGVALTRRVVRGGDTYIIDRGQRLFIAPGLRAARPVGDQPLIRRIRAMTRVGSLNAGALTGATNPLGASGRVIGWAVDAGPRAPTGWTVLIDRSEAADFAGARASLRDELALLALLVVLGAAGALLSGRRLARQYRETQAAEARTRRLQAMTAGLSAASTPDEVAKAVLERYQGATGAVAGSIALLDEEGTRLRTLALVGYSEQVARAFTDYAVDAPLPASEAVRSGAVWLRAGEEVRARYPHLREYQATMVHEAVAALPLATDRGVLGGLALSFSEPAHSTRRSGRCSPPSRSCAHRRSTAPGSTSWSSVRPSARPSWARRRSCSTSSSTRGPRCARSPTSRSPGSPTGAP